MATLSRHGQLAALCWLFGRPALAPFSLNGNFDTTASR